MVRRSSHKRIAVSPYAQRLPAKSNLHLPDDRAMISDRRRGAALMVALFVMALTSIIVVGIMDTEMAHYAALSNTVDYDRARYLAEAGLAHAVAHLEEDITWRDGVPATEFPAGSGNTYSATAIDGPDAMVIVTATGTSGVTTRRLQATIKHGG